jgi:MtN3 and saliva related transmembrane protein
MATSILAVLASSWGVLMGISPVLQIRQMLRERSSREVSLGYYVILLAGFLIWISYGIAAQNLVLVIPNTIALLVGLTLVAVALRLRRPLPAQFGILVIAIPLIPRAGEQLPEPGSAPRPRLLGLVGVIGVTRTGVGGLLGDERSGAS